MVAQHLAAGAPDRVTSLTLMMTTSGSRRLPGPTWRAQRALMSAPASREPAALVAHMEHVLDTIGSPGYPPERRALRQRIAENLARSHRPAGTLRQLAAVAADGDRTALLARLSMPVRIIHGEADPLVPVACGRDLAARVHGAEGDFIPGMGHDLPQPLLARFADGIAHNARRAKKPRT
jgi:pimeloyl-ACP methyl ester carboxylesterase